jgi:phosphoribosylformylglycinamidine cyclo-ligase
MCGATDNILLSSTIGRNKNLITADVISVINGTEELIKGFTFGVTIHSTGGKLLLMLGTLFVPLL